MGKIISPSELFIKLTEYVMPHGKESMMEPYLPDGYTKDEVGNYVKVIGNSRTMFTCHLDCAVGTVKKVNHVFFVDEHGRNKVKTDRKTILGSDDKAGMVVMLKMIENNIPGHYYFFIGEERGCVGSSGIIKKNRKYFKENFDRCIAFDRRGYGSIISKQRGDFCCSQDFVTALAAEFAKSGLEYKDDPTGIYTDSAQFMYTIPECTNLSCGGFKEHTYDEFQNLDYLEKVCKAVINIDWENLPIKRDPVDPWERREAQRKELLKKNYPNVDLSKKKKSVGDSKEQKPPTAVPLTYKTYPNIKLLRERYQKQKKKKSILDLRFGRISGIELLDTLTTYMLYYGFYLYSTEKVKDSILSIFIRKEENGQHVMFTEPVGIGPIKNVTGVIEEEDIGQFPFVKTVSVIISGSKISFMDNIYKDLNDFEKGIGIGFPQKFYPYIDEFIKDIRRYSMKIDSNRITSIEVTHILRSYGHFTFGDLSTYYEDLFDGEFILTGNGIKV